MWDLAGLRVLETPTHNWLRICIMASYVCMRGTIKRHILSSAVKLFAHRFWLINCIVPMNVTIYILSTFRCRLSKVLRKINFNIKYRIHGNASDDLHTQYICIMYRSVAVLKFFNLKVEFTNGEWLKHRQKIIPTRCDWQIYPLPFKCKWINNETKQSAFPSWHSIATISVTEWATNVKHS